MEADAVRYADRLARTKDKAVYNVDHELRAHGYVRESKEDAEMMTVPGSYMDKHGKILAWYLPHILLPQRQVGSLLSGMGMF